MSDLGYMGDKIVFQVLMMILLILIRWIWNQILKNITSVPLELKEFQLII